MESLSRCTIRSTPLRIFHIRYNDYRATMDINTGEINGNLPRRVLNLVYEWFDQHKDELKENWLRMEKGEEIINIKPLD